MTGESPGDRFRPRDPGAAHERRSVSHEERSVDAREDALEIVDVCGMIVGRGQTDFFSETDPRSRLAAKALLIDLATACERIPEFQSEHPDLWSAIKRTRDKIAHHYADTSYHRVWVTLAEHVPAVGDRLREVGRPR